MVITWHGLSCLKVHVKFAENESSILIDPFAAQGKFKVPRSVVDVVAVTRNGSPEHSSVDEVQGTPFVIETPGEYEIKGAIIRALAFDPQKPDAKVLCLTADGVTLLVATAMEREFTVGELELMGNIDIVAVGVGEKGALEMAVKIINQIEPRIIIPIHYQLPGWPGKFMGKDAFIKALGLSAEEPQQKLKVTRKDLPADETKLVILEG